MKRGNATRIFETETEITILETKTTTLKTDTETETEALRPRPRPRPSKLGIETLKLLGIAYSSACTALEAINADLKGKTYDSPQAVPIGTVACSIMCLVLAAVILLDAGKLYDDLKMMKCNIRRLAGTPTNKVEPSP